MSQRLSCSLAFFILLLWLWTPGVGSSAPPAPAVRLERADQGKTIQVVGLDAANLKALSQTRWDDARWAVLLAVRVDREGSAPLPAMLGAWTIKGNVLRFEPRFPFAQGLTYRAVLDLSRLPHPPSGKTPYVDLRFANPRPRKEPTVIRAVYPTSDRLPENQLKFYIHFSGPMRQGDSYRHIKLFEASGKEVLYPFLELGEELWGQEGTRFTLFFDPGRIKRGLKPREDVGPSLIEGKKYTLVIDRGWLDTTGQPLSKTFRKTFSVGAPDETCPEPKKWKLEVPAAHSRDALTVRLEEPLDHALLQRMLWLVGPAGRVEGTIAVSDGETRWRFTPKAPWRAGNYRIEADTRLEDLAGNSIGRPFEVDVLRRIERRIEQKTVAVLFQVKPSPGSVSLFDGTSLKGWEVMNGGKFVAEDGVIKLHGGRGWLRSEKEYSDFVLRLEVRWMKPKQDSGIFLRASKEGKNWPNKRYEVQCENSPRIAYIFGAKHTRDAEKAFKLLKGPKEWNTFEITCSGPRCEVTFNGEKVSVSEDFKNRKGYIGLQGEGGELEFRNLFIKERETPKKP
jgi:3-keto-disaccharide hydrolase